MLLGDRELHACRKQQLSLGNRRSPAGAGLLCGGTLSKKYAVTGCHPGSDAEVCLRMEQGRIAERSARVILATTKLVVSSAISIILLPCYSAQSQYNDPHELTSRCVI